MTTKRKTRLAAVTAILGSTAAVAVIVAAPSYADDGASDQTFRTGLDDQGVLFNFRLEKSEGQSYCDSLIGGEAPLDAIYDLMRNGSYSFDVANRIASSASTAYCECAYDQREGIKSILPCSPYEIDSERLNAG